jgi:general secretion pathway protein F/type IV pilus assembly protein PilC
LAYPVILAILGTLVLFGLIIFIVPRFEPIFKSLDEQGQLPTLTIMIIAVSHSFLSFKALIILGVVIAGVVAFLRWKNTPNGRLRLDGWRLKVPGMGRIYLNYALSRFTRILGTLLHNGIPILRALKIAEDATGNRVLTQAIDRSAENVKAGDSLATPLAACNYFPRDVVEMISVGEESNSLETVLVHISEGLEKRTSRQLDLFVRLLEPLMLLVMAAVILVIVAGLLMPVFRMASVVK